MSISLVISEVEGSSEFTEYDTMLALSMMIRVWRRRSVSSLVKVLIWERWEFGRAIRASEIFEACSP